MARMPTSMAKNPKPKVEEAKEAAVEATNEMLSQAEEMRQKSDVSERGRRTLEQLQEEAKNLGNYARGKVEHVNDAMHEAAASARESTERTKAAAPSAEDISDTVMDSLKVASEKLSGEISDLGERVQSVKARVAQSMQNAGGKAKDTWQQSAEAAKTAGGKAKDTWYQSTEAVSTTGKNEYCLPLPIDRICARHVAVVGIPLLALVLLMVFRRRYPKKWKASVNKMKDPSKMLARDMPSSDKIKSQLGGVADTVGEKLEYVKQRGSTKMDEVRIISASEAFSCSIDGISSSPWDAAAAAAALLFSNFSAISAESIWSPREPSSRAAFPFSRTFALTLVGAL
ncbi:uncharacterized protein CCR75_003310 [Bremia lactucae]|uniref:Uncharacterized protein n=1 Tax=Bremia lactucae TaxID=4779 RepID=A0A976IL04_BRELC|nr:hypothetical protein CCR75_003310 [Bremia lactucae]